jgi:hypothetical protein
LKDVRGEIDSAIEDVLAGITIEDIVRRLKPGVQGSDIRKKRAGATSRSAPSY